MTTGRINQVATVIVRSFVPSAGRMVAPPGDETTTMIRDRSRSVLHSRVVFLLQQQQRFPFIESERPRPPSCSRYRTATAATTNRLPLLPCASRVLVGEAEIYKTVEFVTKKSSSESIVPDQLPCDEHVPRNRCPGAGDHLPVPATLPDRAPLSLATTTTPL